MSLVDRWFAEQLLIFTFLFQQTKFGQLTYLRMYQGGIDKGSNIYNTRTGRRAKASRLVRMHANKMEVHFMYNDIIVYVFSNHVCNPLYPMLCYIRGLKSAKS